MIQRDVQSIAHQRNPHWLVYLQHRLLDHVQVHSSKGQCDTSTGNGVARRHGNHNGITRNDDIQRNHFLRNSHPRISVDQLLVQYVSDVAPNGHLKGTVIQLYSIIISISHL